MSVQGIVFTSQLSPPRSAEVWFPSAHMALDLGEFASVISLTPSTSNYATMQVVFGVKGLDSEGVDIYRPDVFQGKAILDPAFDLSTSEAQNAVLATCRAVRTLKCSLEGCDNAGYGTLMLLSDKPTDFCFLEAFQDWNGGLLPTGAAFEPRLKEFSDLLQNNRTVFEHYVSDTLEEVKPSEIMGFIGDKLKFVRIFFLSSMQRVSPYSKGIKVRDYVDDWAAGQASMMPPSLKSIRVTDSRGIFGNYDLSVELLNGLFSGCAIAAPVVFLVLLASTRNIIVAFYAVISVSSVVFCVLGFCKSAMDWDLGIGEAIAGVIVIGYSVDYIVHLAHMYCEAHEYGYEHRGDRAAFAIRNMGSTIFAGALTTAGAGSIMFACFLTFFFKMALLITVTIMYSFLFSLGFFMSLVWLIGPEGTLGNLYLPQCISQRLFGTYTKSGPDAVEEFPSPTTQAGLEELKLACDGPPKPAWVGPAQEDVLGKEVQAPTVSSAAPAPPALHPGRGITIRDEETQEIKV